MKGSDRTIRRLKASPKKASSSPPQNSSLLRSLPFKQNPGPHRLPSSRALPQLQGPAQRPPPLQSRSALKDQRRSSLWALPPSPSLRGARASPPGFSPPAFRSSSPHSESEG